MKKIKIEIFFIFILCLGFALAFPAPGSGEKMLTDASNFVSVETASISK